MYFLFFFLVVVAVVVAVFSRYFFKQWLNRLLQLILDKINQHSPENLLN